MIAYITAIEGNAGEMTVTLKIRSVAKDEKAYSHLHLGECGLVQGDE